MPKTLSEYGHCLPGQGSYRSETSAEADVSDVQWFQMTEHVHARFSAKGGKHAPATDRGSHKPILMWGPVISPPTGTARIAESIKMTVHRIGVGPESMTSPPLDLYRQALEGVRGAITNHGENVSIHFHADADYTEYMHVLQAHLQSHQQHGAQTRGILLIQHHGNPLMEVDDATEHKGIRYLSGLPSGDPYSARSARHFMRVLPLSGKEEASFDLFGHLVPTSSPIVAPSTPPQPTVEDRLIALLAKLQNSSKKGQEFDAKVVASIDAMLDEHPAARTALLGVARGEPAPAGRPTWAPRVRWFAVEQLRHWSLPESGATEILPAPSYLETLIEAIESWEEDEALYGAVVNARLVKVGAVQRAKLREALIRRLSSKTNALERTMTVFEAQLIGQMLCTFGSFACSDDLELLGRFALADSAFAVRTHALEALRRIVCREPDAPATDAFFDDCTDKFVELCRSCMQLRRSSEPAGTLLWSAIGVLLGRFGEESFIVADLARAYPKLRRDIALEIDRATEHLTRVGQTKRLEKQIEVKRQLADSIAASVPTA